jgi:hypothetical protein
MGVLLCQPFSKKTIEVYYKKQAAEEFFSRLYHSLSYSAYLVKS